MRFFRVVQQSISNTGRTTALGVLASFFLVYTWFLGHIQCLRQLGPGLWATLNALGSDSAILICLFKRYLQIPCPFCGLTRSFTLIGQGQWLTSLDLHPLGIPLYLLTVYFALASLLKPNWADRLLRYAGRPIFYWTGFTSFLLAWCWKLGHNPHFW